MNGFETPLRAELPLDGLEAFRLASFGIEYAPQYAPVMVDEETRRSRLFWVAYGDLITRAWGLEQGQVRRSR